MKIHFQCEELLSTIEINFLKCNQINVIILFVLFFWSITPRCCVTVEFLWIAVTLNHCHAVSSVNSLSACSMLSCVLFVAVCLWGGEAGVLLTADYS